MISDSQSANKYYRIVNDFIDVYINKHKVRPSRLHKYLLNSDKLKNLLERSGLTEISNIKRIISDVLEDRISLEKDGVMTFEGFLNESKHALREKNECLWFGIEKSNILHEKILSNSLSVSLSEIGYVNSDRHFFRVDKNIYVVYTENDLSIIGENIREYCIENLKKTVSMGDLEIHLYDFIDIKKLSDYLDNYLTREYIMSFICYILGCDNLNSERDFVGKLD